LTHNHRCYDRPEKFVIPIEDFAPLKEVSIYKSKLDRVYVLQNLVEQKHSLVKKQEEMLQKKKTITHFTTVSKPKRATKPPSVNNNQVAKQVAKPMIIGKKTSPPRSPGTA